MMSKEGHHEFLSSKGSWPVCRPVHPTHPFGVFYGENPLDYSFPLMLLKISMVIVITRILRFLLKPLGQPRIVSEIIGGIIIGPSVLGHNKEFATHIFPDNANYVVQSIGILGFMYFLFVTGVKMDLTTIQRAEKKQWYIALIGVFIPVIVTGSIAMGLRKNLDKELTKGSSIWGVSTSLAITAFPVIYPILRELNLLNSEIGRIALSTAMISDVIGINGVLAFEAAKQGEHRRMAALWYMISLVVVMIVTIGGARKGMMWIVKTTPAGKPVEQIYVVGILMGVMVAGFVTDMCGLAIANGPMWLGLAVPDGPPLGATLVEKSEMMVMEVLMPFAFAYVGMTTDVYSMKGRWESLEPMFYMAVAGYVTKMLATLAATRFADMTLREGLALSLVMSLRGQVELLLFLHWMDLKMITVPYFTMMVLLTTAVTAVSTPFIGILCDPTRPYMIDKRRNIQHQPPNSDFQIVVCVHDDESVSGFINLLEASHPTPAATFSIHALRLVELVGRAAPVFLDHENSDNGRLSTVHTVCNPIHNALMLFQRRWNEIIQVHCYTSVSPKRSMYQDICELALTKKASLIILPSHREFLESVGDTKVREGIRSVNENVLANAPCSVGILFGKGSSRSPGPVITSSMRRGVQNFVVVFLGGADSREALAYADRMAENPNVRLTVVRFLAENGEGDLEMEKKLDDGLVTWFWVKNEANSRVIYREVTVKNGEETIAAIQAINGDYVDLWVVGRKQGVNPVLIMGLTHWSESNELGVIGDYLSSGDFVSTASVLVVQQQVLRGDSVYSGGLRRRLFS